MKFGALITAIVVVFVCVIGAILYNAIPVWQTRKLVREEAYSVMLAIQSEVKINGDVDNFYTNTKEDAWGNSLRYQYAVEPEYVGVAVTSNGPDGLPNTDDDIIGAARDLNKSRIVGKWVGKKLKQASDGLVEGFKEKTVFDKATEEKKPETKETKKKWLDYFKKKFAKDEE